MNTIKELDAVALMRDLPAHGLQRGDVGTVVLVHGDGEAFEVEFVGYDGHTVALVTLERGQVRPLHASDIPDARGGLGALARLGGCKFQILIQSHGGCMFGACEKRSSVRRLT